MFLYKKTILSIIVISIIFVGALFQKRVFAGNNNIVEPEQVEYTPNTVKQNMMEKIIECMSVGLPNVVTAYKVDGQWRAEIKAYEIKSNWEPIDILRLQITEGMNISYSREDDMVIVYFHVDDFQLGAIATLLFNNPSKHEYSIIFINFSDSYDLIFQTDALRRLVAGDNAIDYLYFNGETRKIIVLEEQYILEEHTNTGVIPPHEIESANYDVLLYRSNKDRSETSSYSKVDPDGFEVFGTNDEYIRSFQSPFAAVEYIVKNDLEGYFVYDVSSGQEAFRYDKERDDLFYLFDGSHFYGTANVMDATSLTIQYKHYHSIRADGIFGAGGGRIWKFNPENRRSLIPIATK